MADQSTLSDLSQRIGVLMESLGEKLRQFASAGTMPDDHAEKAKEMHAKAETIRAKLPEGEGVAGEIERDLHALEQDFDHWVRYLDAHYKDLRRQD